MEDSRENWSPGNPEGGSFERGKHGISPKCYPEYQKPEPTPEQELARIYNEYRPRVSLSDKGKSLSYFRNITKGTFKSHPKEFIVEGKPYVYGTAELSKIEKTLNEDLENCYKNELKELYDPIQETQPDSDWKERIATIELRYATEAFLIAEKNEQLDAADRAYAKCLDGEIKRWESLSKTGSYTTKDKKDAEKRLEELKELKSNFEFNPKQEKSSRYEFEKIKSLRTELYLIDYKNHLGIYYEEDYQIALSLAEFRFYWLENKGCDEKRMNEYSKLLNDLKLLNEDLLNQQNRIIREQRPLDKDISLEENRTLYKTYKKFVDWQEEYALFWGSSLDNLDNLVDLEFEKWLKEHKIPPKEPAEIDPSLLKQAWEAERTKTMLDEFPEEEKDKAKQTEDKSSISQEKENQDKLKEPAPHPSYIDYILDDKKEIFSIKNHENGDEIEHVTLGEVEKWISEGITADYLVKHWLLPEIKRRYTVKDTEQKYLEENLLILANSILKTARTIQSNPKK